MHAVVLAGGAGTRFWPASRRARPKPFIPLLGGRTLLAETLERLRPLAPPERTWVVASREIGRVVRRSLPPRARVRLLLEPEGRNTAAAVAWAAARLAAEGDGRVMAVFPADHHIPDRRAFRRAVAVATRAAAGGSDIVLIGIEPTRPESGYGYLRLADAAGRGAVPVRRFVEKPTQARARRFLEAGRYLWNAGMLVAAPARILEETRRWAPEVWRGLGGVLRDLAAGRRVSRARLDRAYARVRPIPFDRAVLERSDRVLAVRGRFRWSDVGNWDALGEQLPLWEGNRVNGTRPAALVESADNLIWNTTGKAVALLGVSRLVVVETEDALLVCPRERAQDVPRVLDRLASRGWGDLA